MPAGVKRQTEGEDIAKVNPDTEPGAVPTPQLLGPSEIEQIALGTLIQVATAHGVPEDSRIGAAECLLDHIRWSAEYQLKLAMNAPPPQKN